MHTLNHHPTDVQKLHRHTMDEASPRILDIAAPVADVRTALWSQQRSTVLAVHNTSTLKNRMIKNPSSRASHLIAQQPERSQRGRSRPHWVAASCASQCRLSCPQALNRRWGGRVCERTVGTRGGVRIEPRPRRCLVLGETRRGRRARCGQQAPCPTSPSPERPRTKSVSM